MPFCRAANGALATRLFRVSLLAMAILRVVSAWIARLRAQRWSKEVLLAVGLTLAAVVFIVAAISGQDAPVRDRAPYADVNR